MFCPRLSHVLAWEKGEVLKQVPCLEERCTLWNAVAGECAERVVLVALPPSLSELNSHLADLVELLKRAEGIVVALGSK